MLFKMINFLESIHDFSFGGFTKEVGSKVGPRKADWIFWRNHGFPSIGHQLIVLYFTN